MKRFHVSIHDATPAHAHETHALLQALAPRLGRRLSLAVVPNWHGEWPLAAHPAYCQLLLEGAEELLLHGYYHRRRRGHGPLAVFAGNCDEMSGLTRSETQRTIEDGQRVFRDVFGTTARGFLAPGWQPGHVRPGSGITLQVDHVLGFFSLDAAGGRTIPLATCTWDCGRWGCLGYLGHGLGRLLRSLDRGVPVLAIHPIDRQRGFLPAILHLVDELLEHGYQPSTLAGLLEAGDGEAAA